MGPRSRGLILARAAFVAFALFASHLPAPAVASDGVVSGVVLDARARSALPGALVRIARTSLEAVADSRGRFRIAGVPDGEQVVEVSYLGFEPGRQALRVENGRTPDVEVTLRLRGLTSDSAFGLQAWLM